MDSGPSQMFIGMEAYIFWAFRLAFQLPSNYNRKAFFGRFSTIFRFSRNSVRPVFERGPQKHRKTAFRL
jgi:hypothetical protein